MEAHPISRSPTESPQPHRPTAEHLVEAYIATQQAQTTIDAGTDDSDGGGYDSEYGSRASTSMSSSVRDYAFEQGRRYHKFREGAYIFPNDEPEQEREDMKHAMVVNLCGVGDEYPSAQILGIDLSPIQPVWVPSNVKFMVDDAESQWLHPPDCFDFVHIRHMTSALKNWPKSSRRHIREYMDLRRLFSTLADKDAYSSHLQPGGWVELQDIHFLPQCDDETMKDDYALSHFINFVADGLAVFGINLHATTRNAQYLRDAGFVNVEVKCLKIPIGIWPRNRIMKIVGLYLRSVIYDGLQGISLIAFTKGLGWSTEEIEVFLVTVRRAIMDHSIHSYLRFYISYGQKPVEA